MKARWTIAPLLFLVALSGSALADDLIGNPHCEQMSSVVHLTTDMQRPRRHFRVGPISEVGRGHYSIASAARTECRRPIDISAARFRRMQRGFGARQKPRKVKPQLRFRN